MSELIFCIKFWSTNWAVLFTAKHLMGRGQGHIVVFFSCFYFTVFFFFLKCSMTLHPQNCSVPDQWQCDRYLLIIFTLNNYKQITFNITMWQIFINKQIIGHRKIHFDSPIASDTQNHEARIKRIEHKNTSYCVRIIYI